MQAGQAPEKNFVISQGIAQEVLNYLANRPYAEVFSLVQAIQNLKEIDLLPVPEKPAGEPTP